MTLRFFISVFLASIFLHGCGSTSRVVSGTKIPVRAHSIQSVMWQQNAAEYRALCYQAFNLAKMQLDLRLEAGGFEDKTPAIITDIDETVLDNSPYAATLIKKDEEYIPETWAEWVYKKEAQAIPGAVEFLNYAKEKGVIVYYISNRLENEIEPTVANLKKFNFPYAEADYMLFRGDTGSKQARFEKVEKNHSVLLYLGDNLSDFTEKFRAPSTEERNMLADQLRDRFGTDYIVLPNASYGDWEDKGIYRGRYDWTPAQKDSIHRAVIRGYQ